MGLGRAGSLSTPLSCQGLRRGGREQTIPGFGWLLKGSMPPEEQILTRNGPLPSRRRCAELRVGGSEKRPMGVVGAADALECFDRLAILRTGPAADRCRMPDPSRRMTAGDADGSGAMRPSSRKRSLSQEK